MRPELYSRGCAFFLSLYFAVMPVLAVFIPKPLGVATSVMGGVCLLGFIATGIRPRIDWGAGFLMLLVLLLGWMSMAWSPDSGVVAERVLKLASFFLPAVILLAAVAVIPAMQRLQVLKYLPIALATASIVMFAEYLSDYPLYRFVRGVEEGEKLKPVILNRGTVMATLLVWPACFYLVKTGKEKYVWPLILLVLLSALCVFSSQSALLGLLTGAGCWLAMGWKKYSQHIIRIVFFGVAVSALLAPWIAKGLYAWQPGMVQQWKVAAAPQRLTIWNAVAIETLDRPFYGYGLEATRTLGEKITQHTTDYEWKGVYHPHNFMLQIWIELGLAGVLLFIGFLFVLYKGIASCSSGEQRAMLACFSAAVAIGLVGYGLWQSWWLGALLSAALACALLKEEKV